MLPTKKPARWPAATSTSPYCRRLRALLELRQLDSETAGVLAGMVRCVSELSYGRVRTLYRLLPMAHRKQLGAPPASADRDVNEHLDW